MHAEAIQKIVRTDRKWRMMCWEQFWGIVNGRALDWHQCEGDRKKKKRDLNTYGLWIWIPFMVPREPKEGIWVIEITFGCGKLFSWLQFCSETKLSLAQVYKVTQACGYILLVHTLLTLCYGYLNLLFVRQQVPDTCLNRFKIVPSGWKFCCVPSSRKKKKVQNRHNWDIDFCSPFLFRFLILQFSWGGESTLKVIMLLALGLDFLNTSSGQLEG